MKAKAFILLAALLGISTASTEAQVIVDTLPNGLTYYIRHNDNPAGKADFFIAQRVGSVNEDENQRGLAHFLEHMCFNGTEHYPDRSLIEYLESVGVKFGANLNAYTSFDETVYNICKVPTARTSTLDSCFMILRDWSCGLLLNDDDIDAERGVIVNEWRHRNAASNRMLEKAAPRLYPGSAYGDRMPIGLMSVVENFKPEELRDYYHKWYNPMNQAIIVVGDIDTDYAQAKIKELFGPIKSGEHSRKSYDLLVADNPELIAVAESDPEQSVTMVQLHFKHAPARNDIRQDIVSSLLTGMLARRYDTMEADPECPHNSLGIGDMKFMLSRPVSSLVLRGPVKPGRAADAVKAWNTEVVRALKHGFSADELEESRNEVLAHLDERLRRSQSTDNTIYAKGYVRNFIDGETPVEAADYDRQAREILASITVDEITDYLAKVADPKGRNVVILVYQPDREGTKKTTEDELRNAYLSVDEASLEPFVYEAVDPVLLPQLPEPGKIKKVKKLPKFNANLYTLSNGVKVYTRYNDAKKGQIFIRGIGSGGFSQNYTEENIPEIKLLVELAPEFGYGKRSASEMRRFLTGKPTKVSASINNVEESIETATTADDVENALQLMYLRITDPQPDPVAFRNFVAAKRDHLNRSNPTPVQVMGDSIHHIIYGRHPLARNANIDMLENLSLDRALEIYRDRYGDVSDFTFYITGDFDQKKLEELMCRYIASLPAAGRIEKPRDIGYRYIADADTIAFTMPMTTPVSILYHFYNGPTPYTLDNILRSGAMSQILRTRLLNELRERRGLTYGVKGHCAISANLNGSDAPRFMMPVYIKVEPGHAREASEVINATLDDMAAGNITAEEVATIREQMLQQWADSQSDNAYWLSVMKLWNNFGIDTANDYRAAVEKLTPESISKFVKEYIIPSVHNVLILEPEE